MGNQRRVHGDFGPVFTFDSSERTASQTPKSQWLNLVLRRRRLMPSTSPLTSMTSRETARLTPSTPATSSAPATWSLESLQALYMGKTSGLDRNFSPLAQPPPISLMVFRVGFRLQARMRSPA